MEHNGSGITLHCLLELAAKKWLAVLLAATVITGLWWAALQIFDTPEYAATATVYVLAQPQEEQSEEAFALALKLVEDCRFMHKSSAVLSAVIDELGLDMDTAQLSQQITVENPADTRFLEVTVRAASPELARQIADTLCAKAEDKITGTLGSHYTALYSPAIADTTPCNRTGILDYAKIALATALLTYTVLLLDHLKKQQPAQK